jgi:hypothetical protein
MKTERRPFIPRWLDELGLTPPQRAVLTHLWRRANGHNECWPAASAIIKACKISENTLWDALRVLEGRRLLARRKTYRNANVYRLLIPDSVTPNETVTERSESPQRERHLSPQTDGLHSPQTDGRQGTPSKAAATAAATDGETSTQLDHTGIAAFPGACTAPVAALPDGTWLKDQLSLLELHRVQAATPVLAKLELWQIADIYHLFAIRKREYDDAKAARALRPGLQVGQWFADAFQEQRGQDWRDMAGAFIKLNSGTVRSYYLDAREKIQPENPSPTGDGHDWQAQLFEMVSGHPPEMGDSLYDYEAKALPYQTWDKIPRWLRALLCDNYVAGAIPTNR